MDKKKSITNKKNIVVASGDILIAFASYYLAWLLRFRLAFGIFQHPIPAQVFQEVIHLPLLVALEQILFLLFLGLYKNVKGRRLVWLSSRIVFAGILQGVFFFIVYLLLKEYFPSSVLFIFCAVNILFILLWRLIIHQKDLSFSEKEKRFFYYIKTQFDSLLIILFILSLLGCMCLLIVGREKAAEDLANWAYFFLVFGVVIKFVRAIREKQI